MARYKGDVVAKRPEVPGDGTDKSGVIPAWEVSTTDGSGEQHVSNEGEAIRPRMKHHVAGGVTGTVIDVQDLRSDLHGVALMEPARGHEFRDGLEAEHARLLRQQVDPELVIGMGTFDRQVELLGQRLGRPGMIDVRMRKQDLGEAHPPIGNDSENVREITTRVDNRALERFR